MPAEGRIALQIARRLGLFAIAGGIRAQQAVSECTVAMLCAVDVLARCARRREAGAFIRVVADKYRRVVELLSGVKIVLIVGNYIAIDDGPCHAACSAGSSHNFLSRQAAQLRDVRGSGIRCKSETAAFRVSQ